MTDAAPRALALHRLADPQGRCDIQMTAVAVALADGDGGLTAGAGLASLAGAGMLGDGGVRVKVRLAQMLFEVAVVAGGNSPMDLNRVFDLLTEPRAVARVLAPDPAGADDDVWCDVTGWQDGAPCPALAALAEDSGEGVVMLIYGGEDGIRLKAAEPAAEWDGGDGRQWGEPCLMLGSEVRIEYALPEWAPARG